MMRPQSFLLFMAAALAAAPLNLFGQVNLAYSFRIPGATTGTGVSPAGTVAFPTTDLGTTSALQFSIENRGTAPVTIDRVTVTGAAFSLVSSVQTILSPAGIVNAALNFTPTAAQPFAGSLEVAGSVNGQPFNASFFLSGAGVAPDFVTSFILNPDGNQTAIADGGTITFPNTIVNQTRTATFIVLNRGTGRGAVTAVTLTGAGFRISGLPLFPTTILPDRDIRFTITFAPEARQVFAGSVRLDFGTGTPPRTIRLAGESTAAAFGFQLTAGGNTTALEPGGSIRFPQTNVNATSMVSVTVINSGNSDGRLEIPSLPPGSAFRIEGIQPPLPATLRPGDTARFSIVFAPREAGDATAQLQVGTVAFQLTGVGLGSRLRLESTISGVTSPVADGGTVIFPQTAAGGRSPVTFAYRNEGNAPGTVNGVTVSNALFQVSGLPPLPAVIPPGQQISFTIAFAPDSVALSTAVLQLDDRTFNLRGQGAAPAALPTASLTELAATAEPLQQPSIGVRIASPYSLEVTGRLTLAFSSDVFGDDPTILFSNNSRTVDFRIPVGQTEAVFATGGNRIQFQTGTVAGTITLSATFATGSINLTPSPAPSRATSVASGPPRLRSVQIGTRNSQGFELLITGYATSRSLTTMTLNFAASGTGTLQTTSLTVPAEAPFSSWYQNAASRAFGSQFTASVFVNVTAGSADAIQSVSVTTGNAQGSSNAVSVNLR
jgi:hypothetical protein